MLSGQNVKFASQLSAKKKENIQSGHYWKLSFLNSWEFEGTIQKIINTPTHPGGVEKKSFLGIKILRT